MVFRSRFNKAKKFFKREGYKKNLKLDFKNPIIIFTQHSVTTEFNNSAKQIQQSLIAMKKLLIENVQVIITYPNNDAGQKYYSRNY